MIAESYFLPPSVVPYAASLVGASGAALMVSVGVTLLLILCDFRPAAERALERVGFWCLVSGGLGVAGGIWACAVRAFLSLPA
ncbi:MAG: hypothetical protein LBC18_03135 [Opitutaceae bacterium]|nr:hypothetical protein [Opitutaceae bacterium]